MLQTFLTSRYEWAKSTDFTEEFFKTYNENSEIGYFWKLNWSILKSGVISITFGRTIEHVRKSRNVKLVTRNEQRNYLVLEPCKKEVFGKIAYIEIRKTEVKIDKPAHLGFSMNEYIRKNIPMQPNCVTCNSFKIQIKNLI